MIRLGATSYLWNTAIGRSWFSLIMWIPSIELITLGGKRLYPLMRHSVFIVFEGNPLGDKSLEMSVREYPDWVKRGNRFTPSVTGTAKEAEVSD